MGKAVRIVLVVACGVAGAWAGYWLGHLAGWSEDAAWPRQIGGGTGAILLSVALSVTAAIVAALLLLRPVRQGKPRD
jgi:hypothetical protein